MGTMEDLNGLEAVFRRIAREEITRAMGAAGAVAEEADRPYETDQIESTALTAITRVMERVARDVLADTHPALDIEHTTSTSTPACTCSCRACFTCTEQEHTASTEPVHTITAVPERARAACTCHRHTHVMGHDDRCGAPFCYCLTPVRARVEHTDEHASTDDLDYNRPCTSCGHGEHDRGRCGMHVYRRGEAVSCPCLASRTVRSQASTGARVVCTVCEHAPHGAGNCGAVEWPATAPCECGAQAEPIACPVCAHMRHVGMCTAIRNGGACECGGSLREGGRA